MHIAIICLFFSLHISTLTHSSNNADIPFFELDSFKADSKEPCVLVIENDVRKPYFATPPRDLETFYNGSSIVDDEYVLYHGQKKEIEIEDDNIVALIPVNPLMTGASCVFCHDHIMKYVISNVPQNQVIKISTILRSKK